MISFKNYLKEGGNVFTEGTSPIKKEDIDPTLVKYFQELARIFPGKKAIFNRVNFFAVGSVGKKAISGDIDLAVDSKDLLDKDMTDKSIALWGLDPKKVAETADKLAARARTSGPTELRMKAFLQNLVHHINTHSKLLQCDEKKITTGNIFGRFPQFTTKSKTDEFIQIDWMVGNVGWLKFSYYSSSYPEKSNVKGLHRTQLMLAAFQVTNHSFDHVHGVRHKDTRDIVATSEKAALLLLNKELGIRLTPDIVEDFYKLNTELSKIKPALYQQILDIYFKIMDSTRADIPDILQSNWIKNKSRLNLTGKFLPADSKLNTLHESGSTGADRIASRDHFKQFLKSYESKLKKFPGFVSITPSGSYNSDASKTSFGDIDLITHINSDEDKSVVKKRLSKFLEELPHTVVVPFTSPRYSGKRSLNTGEIVSIRYHDDKLGYSVQIDNIIALDREEANFKQQFLDFPAEKQGLILGLIKTVMIETKVDKVFKLLKINQPTKLPKNQEYEFNLSSTSLQLRLVTYEEGTFIQKSRVVLWSSTDFELVSKLLHKYDLSGSFDNILSTAKKTLKNSRSPMRMVGVFKTMISVKSGEVGTEKGANKLKSIDAVSKIFV